MRNATAVIAPAPLMNHGIFLVVMIVLAAALSGCDGEGQKLMFGMDGRVTGLVEDDLKRTSKKDKGLELGGKNDAFSAVLKDNSNYEISIDTAGNATAVWAQNEGVSTNIKAISSK